MSIYIYYITVVFKLWDAPRQSSSGEARREKKINPKKNLKVDDSNHQSYFNCRSNITKYIFNRLSSCKPFNKSTHLYLQ